MAQAPSLNDLLGRVGPLSESCCRQVDECRLSLAQSLAQMLDLEAERSSLEDARRRERVRLHGVAARAGTPPDVIVLSALAIQAKALDRHLDAARELVAQKRKALIAASREGDSLAVTIHQIRAGLEMLVHRVADEEARARMGGEAPRTATTPERALSLH